MSPLKEVVTSKEPEAKFQMEDKEIFQRNLKQQTILKELDQMSLDKELKAKI